MGRYNGKLVFMTVEEVRKLGLTMDHTSKDVKRELCKLLNWEMPLTINDMKDELRMSSHDIIKAYYNLKKK